MPNTLAHIAINGILTRSIIRPSGLIWIYIGCLIPDAPWILRRIIEFVFPTLNGNDLQAYLIVQASLFFCLILSLLLALLNKATLKTFLILSLGSLLHLLVDALQIKWANGVHLLAPFSWELFYNGIIWPDHFLTYLLTISGLVYFILNFKEILGEKLDVEFTNIKLLIFLLVLSFYVLGPLIFVDKIYENDCHYVHTLSDFENRIRKYAEFDRKSVTYNDNSKSYWINTFDENRVELSNIENLKSDNISVRGTFVKNNSLYVEEYHENWEFFRDGASYIGILLIFIVVVRSLSIGLIIPRKNQN